MGYGTWIRDRNARADFARSFGAAILKCLFAGGIVIFAVVLFYGTGEPRAAAPTTVAQPPIRNDAEGLIALCGTPDEDVRQNAGTTGYLIRVIAYRKYGMAATLIVKGTDAAKPTMDVPWRYFKFSEYPSGDEITDNEEVKARLPCIAH